jgi:hypothetical protein
MTNTTTNTTKFQFFKTYEDYSKFLYFWKNIANAKEADFLDNVIYTLVKGNDIKKSFKPVTDETKLRCNLNGFGYMNLQIQLFSLSYKLKKTGFSLGDWDTVLDADSKKKLELLVEDAKKLIGEK